MDWTNEGQAADGDLLKTIAAFRRGSKAYEACKESEWTVEEDCEAAVLGTFGPHLKTLETWSAPAADQREAIEALRFALSENRTYDGPRTVSAMLKAVIGFLEAAPH